MNESVLILTPSDFLSSILVILILFQFRDLPAFEVDDVLGVVVWGGRGMLRNSSAHWRLPIDGSRSHLIPHGILVGLRRKSKETVSIAFGRESGIRTYP